MNVMNKTLLFPEFRDGASQNNLFIATIVNKEVAPALLSVGDENESVLEVFESSSIAVVKNPLTVLKLNAIRAEGYEQSINIDETKLKQFCEAIAMTRSTCVVDEHEIKESTEYKFSKLTKRELQLVSLLWLGFTTNDIALYWHRSELTVTKHRENLNTKIGHRMTPQDMHVIRVAQSIIAELS